MKTSTPRTIGRLPLVAFAAFVTIATALKAADRAGLPAVILPPIKTGPSVELHKLPVAAVVMNAAVNQIQSQGINLSMIAGQDFMVNDCLGIKLSAGDFILKFGPSHFTIDTTGIDLDFAIQELSLTVLSFKVKPRVPDFSDPNPCDWSGSFGVGASASDIRLTAHCAPRIRLDDCQLLSIGDLAIDFSIGSLHVDSVPSLLVEGAKRLIVDQVNSTLGSSMPGILKGAINDAVLTEICADKYWIYQAYMDFMEFGVSVHPLPQEYVDLLQPLYPKIDLRSYRFGYSNRQPPANATTDCDQTFFNDEGFVNRLRDGTLTDDDANGAGWYWLLHELQHVQQCTELGGRRNFAERWFRDLELSILVTHLDDPSFFDDLHNHMPMEEDAIAKAHGIVTVAGLTTAAGPAAGPVAGVEVSAFPAGTPVSGSTAPAARAISGSAGPSGQLAGEYFLFLPAGSYDLYVRGPGGAAPILAAPATAVTIVDTNGDGFPDVEGWDLSLAGSAVPNSDPISSPGAVSFRRGDSNESGAADLSDALNILAWLFLDGEAPTCQKAADVNDDGAVDITDPLALLSYLFLGGMEPPPPFETPGADPTPDDLPCARS
jgi:hypothetical protein